MAAMLDFIQPSLVLATLLSTAYGAAFHLIFGGARAKLVLYLLAGWLGFGLGQWLGSVLHITALDIGAVHTLTATAGCWLALGTARLLSSDGPATGQVSKRHSRRRSS